MRLCAKTVQPGPQEGEREGKGREGKGREGKGREGKGREGKGREGKGRELYAGLPTLGRSSMLDKHTVSKPHGIKQSKAPSCQHDSHC